MKKNQIAWAGCAICLYTVWNARDLLSAWEHSPYDRLGWVAFLFWLLPLLRQSWRGHVLVRGSLFGAGLALSLVGVIFDLNAIKYAGMAIALGGYFPYKMPVLILWLACAVAWMPVLGWTLSVMGVLPVSLVRLVIALLPFVGERHE